MSENGYTTQYIRTIGKILTILLALISFTVTMVNYIQSEIFIAYDKQQLIERGDTWGRWLASCRLTMSCSTTRGH